MVKLYKNNQEDDKILKEDRNYLKQIVLTKDDIWLDAGSHIGGFTLNIFDKVCQVIAVEPDKKNFVLLKKNIKANKILNVILENKAIVSHQQKSQDFFLNSQTNKGLHSLLVSRGRKKVKVDCININELIKVYHINKIKMDIEGSEYDVLKSITDKNYRNIEELVFEFHFKILNDRDMKKYYEVINFLKQRFTIVNYSDKVSWTKVVYCRK